MPIQASQLIAQVSAQGVDTTKSQLKDVGGVVTSTGGIFKNALGGALNLAAGVAGQALQFLSSQLVDSVKVAMAHQDVMAQTAQAIRSTGDASGMTTQSISDLADSLSKVTPFAEDLTEGGENMLLTFTGIGKSVFPQATQTMLDMAQAMHTGPTQEAMLLGKALNDPTTGLTALTRVGVTFSDQEKEQIKTMMAHNDIAGAQKVMLRELQTEFGGSAVAAGKTFGGSLQILQNNLQDVKDKIATALLPMLSNLSGAVAGQVMPALQNFGGWFTANALPVLQEFGAFITADIVPDISKIGAEAGKLAGQAEPVLQGIATTSSTMLVPAMHLASQAFTSINSDTQPIISSIQTQLLPSFKNIVGAVSPIVAGFLVWTQHSDLIPIALGAIRIALQVLITTIALIVSTGAGLINFFTQTQLGSDILKAALILLGVVLTAIAVVTIPSIVTGLAIMAAGAVTTGIGMALAFAPVVIPILAIIAVITGVILAVQHWGQIVNWFEGVFSVVGSSTQAMAHMIGDAFGGLGNLISGVFSGMWGAVKGGINDIIGGIDDFIGFIDAIQIHIPAIGVGPVHTPPLDWNGLGIPKIPLLAGGGLVTQAGMAIVGEQGPEGLILPQGARVIPHNQLGNMGGSGGQQPIIVQAVLEVDGRLMSLALLPHMTSTIRHTTGIWST